jgi:glycosyltransferase involved in cell wall biosynthesis
LNILFISQYFPPEMGAPAARTYELARSWVKVGHRVTVLTAFPHHPTGVIPEGYRGKVFLREQVDGIEVVRSFVYATANKGFFRRTLSYVSFMCSAVLFSPWVRGDFHVVIATSPQFFVAVAGYAISRLKQRPFVFEVRDLWPESIVAVGALKNPFVIDFLTEVEHFLYDRASLIVGVAESTRRILAERGISPDRIEIIPNGIDPELFRCPSGGMEVRKGYHLEDKFIVSYIGTHGMAHALHRVLDAANLLRGEEGIHFLFVGEGAEKEDLIQYSERLALRNVTFVGKQEHSAVPAFLNASDVSLVPLRDAPLFSAVLPSKMFEIMGAGRPVILGVRGEARELLERVEAGLCVAPEDPEQLRDAILRLYRDRDLGRRLGENGRRFVMMHHSRERLAGQYADLLQRVADRSAS